MVSVIIGTYNRPAWLPEAVESVLRQGFGDFELLVVNDGGVDVGDILRSFGDERVRYINKPCNEGTAAAMQRGLEEARGRYVAYLGDDDVWYPHHLEVLVEAAREHPECGLVYSDLVEVFYVKNADGERVPLNKEVQVSRDFNRELMFSFNHVLQVSAMHERELALRVGGFNPDVKVVVEWDLFRKLCFYTDFFHVPVVTGEYYTTISRFSDRVSDKGRKDPKKFCANMRLIRADNPPEPWPKVKKICGILLPGRAVDGGLAVLDHVTTSLAYPCRWFVAAEPHVLAEMRGQRADLFALPTVSAVACGDGVCAHEVVRQVAERENADYIFVLDGNMAPSRDDRLVAAIDYMAKTGSAVVRWENDPADAAVFFGVEDAVLEALSGRCTVPSVPRDFTPDALKVDELFVSAQRCIVEGMPHAAVELLRRAGGITKGNLSENYRMQVLARALAAAGDREEAEVLVRKLVGNGYEHGNRLLLGLFLKDRERYEEAMVELRKELRLLGTRRDAVDKPPFPIRSVPHGAFKCLCALAECLIETGGLEEAAGYLRFASRLCLNRPLPSFLFGRLFKKQGELAAALEAFEAAERLAPSWDTRLCAEKAEVLQLLGRNDEALQVIRDALKRTPYVHRLVRLLVEMWHDGVVEATEALRAVEKFLEYVPGDVEMLFECAELHLECGDEESSARRLRDLLVLVPDHREALALLQRLKQPVREET